MWAEAKLIQKLVNITDAINEACNSCQPADAFKTHQELFKLRNHAERLIHAVMVQGAQKAPPEG